jgi:hypothetical protein
MDRSLSRKARFCNTWLDTEEQASKTGSGAPGRTAGRQRPLETGPARRQLLTLTAAKVRPVSCLGGSWRLKPKGGFGALTRNSELSR